MMMKVEDDTSRKDMPRIANWMENKYTDKRICGMTHVAMIKITNNMIMILMYIGAYVVAAVAVAVAAVAVAMIIIVC